MIVKYLQFLQTGCSGVKQQKFISCSYMEKQSVRSLENPAIITQVDSVTIITLASFTAEPLYGKVTLDWATESEINNIGFNPYRAESENRK